MTELELHYPIGNPMPSARRKRYDGVKTLRTQDTSDPRHFSISAEVSVRHFGTSAELFGLVNTVSTSAEVSYRLRHQGRHFGTGQHWSKPWQQWTAVLA